MEVSGKFVCEEDGCGKSFNNSRDFKRHSRKHSGVKPFACSFPNCSYESGDRSHTLRHIKSVHLKNLLLDDGEQAPDPTTYLNVKEELLDWTLNLKNLQFIFILLLHFLVLVICKLINI